MRYLVPLAVLIVAQIGAAWAIGEADVARPGGAFATIEAASPDVCERACADDTLCMAWSFQAHSCELKAIVPAAIERQGVISGVSARAPASMRARFEPPPPPVTAPVITTHEEDEPAIFATETTHADDASLALLGGPDTEEGLRGGLGNAAQ
ncbi:MAG: hypothetical protein JNL81_04105 [Hyphomonadaceae bacterium]|nr:hypothetical protein [Hyphomonadaceae bacterium]